MYSMLTDREREYLRTFAFKEYAGQGAIVDLGCWLGSSTIALASGLREHSDLQLRSALVHAYDRFIWDGWMNGVSAVRQTPLDGRYKPGESFQEACREQTEPWKDNIRFYPGDLSSIGWSHGPIEFLFVDAMKSWQLTNSIIHDFYPSLIPGISTLVQQDFGNSYVYWIHLITYRLRDYFQPVYDIRYSESLCFKYVKQIPESLLQAEYSCHHSRMMRLTQPLTTRNASWPKRNRPLLRRPSSAAIWRKGTALVPTELSSNYQTSLLEQ